MSDPTPPSDRGPRSSAWTDTPADPAPSTRTPEGAGDADAPRDDATDNASPDPSTVPTKEAPGASVDFRERAKLLPDHNTWLERPATIRALKWGGIALLAATVVAEAILIPDPTPHFEGIDGWVGFHAVYGFITCVAMVLGAKFVLGAVLKREDTYYDG